MPHPSPPSVGAEAPCAAEPTAPADGNVAVGYQAQMFPRSPLQLLTLNAAVSKAAW